MEDKQRFVKQYCDNREQRGMLLSLSELYDQYVTPLTSELKAKEAEIERQIGEYLVLGAKLVKANEENARLKGTLGVEGAKQLLEARQENAELIKLLTELQRFVPSLSRLADDHLQYPGNCNKALAQIESALSKHQPIKKDELTTE